MQKKTWNTIWFKLALILLPVGLYFIVEPFNLAVRQAVFILSMVNVQAVRGYILSFGIWAPIVSFLLMILQSVIAPLPAFIITFANAGLFGWVKGAILSWSSAMAGAALCYAIARIYGRTAVEKVAHLSALREIDVFFKRYGKWAVMITRLLPFISFDVVSYAAGLTAMGFWEFFWATGIGQLPATIVYSYVGEMLVGSVKTFVTGLLLLFALSAFAIMFKQIWRDRHNLQNNILEIK